MRKTLRHAPKVCCGEEDVVEVEEEKEDVNGDMGRKKKILSIKRKEYP